MRVPSKRSAAVVVLGLAGTLLSGCSAIRSAASGCTKPSKQVVDEVMAHAKHDFFLKDTAITTVKFQGNAATAKVTPEARVEGVTNILALRILTNFRDADAFASGIYGTAMFATDANGRVVGPVEYLSESAFTYTQPTSSAWKKALPVLSDLRGGTTGARVYGCVSN